MLIQAMQGLVTWSEPFGTRIAMTMSISGHSRGVSCFFVTAWRNLNENTRFHCQLQPTDGDSRMHSAIILVSYPMDVDIFRTPATPEGEYRLSSTRGMILTICQGMPSLTFSHCLVGIGHDSSLPTMCLWAGYSNWKRLLLPFMVTISCGNKVRTRPVSGRATRILTGKVSNDREWGHWQSNKKYSRWGSNPRPWVY